MVMNFLKGVKRRMGKFLSFFVGAGEWRLNGSVAISITCAEFIYKLICPKVPAGGFHIINGKRYVPFSSKLYNYTLECADRRKAVEKAFEQGEQRALRHGGKHDYI